MPEAKPTPPDPAPNLPRYLTIEQTAARLGYSYQSVALFIHEGRLPAVNIALKPGQTHALFRIREDATLAPRVLFPRF